MKLLATGDLHLGRSPTRIPEAVLDGFSLHEMGPHGAWNRLLEEAVANGVDAVLISGDVVEGEHDFFEGYRALSQGVAALADAGIPVIGVAGNHDTRTLPRLADEVKGFTLLGRGGTWDRHLLEAGSERATIHGWSFPEPHVRRNPLEGATLIRGDGVNLGLLHCDRDQSGSSYAPVRTTDLRTAALDGWILGHIHRPDALTAQRPVGYVGSLAALDPGEMGARGPWLMEIEGGRIREVSHWALAPLRWETLEVDATGVEEPEGIAEQLLAAIRSFAAGIREARFQPRVVGLRIRVTGRTRLRSAMERVLERENLDAIPMGSGGIHYFVERVRFETRPELDLERLAETPDLVGILTTRLLTLEGVGGEGSAPEAAGEAHREAVSRRAELLAGASERLIQVASGSNWSGLDRSPIGDEEVVERLRTAGLDLLDRLLAQREETS